MVPQMTVAHDLSSALLFYQDLPEQYVGQAGSRALNKTAITVRAEAARAIAATYSMKVGVVKDLMKIRNATRADLRARISASGRPIPLIAFSANQTRRGVSVKIKGRKVVTHAFIATMPKTGHVGVYARTGQFGRKGNPKLEKIKQLYSLSIPAAFTQKQIMEALLAVSKSRFGETLRQEVNFIRIKNARG